MSGVKPTSQRSLSGIKMANTQQLPAYTEPQPSQNVVPQPVVTVQPDPSGSTAAQTRGRWKAFAITGYIHVTLGILSVLLGVVAIVFHSFAFFVGHPIWVGICFYIVTGILGIAAAGQKKVSWLTIYLTMSIISAVIAACVVITSSYAILHDHHVCPDWYYGVRSYGGCSTSDQSRLAIDSVILVIAFADMVVAIIGASFTCVPLCCRKLPSYPTVRYQSAPQMIIAAQPHPQPMFHYTGTHQNQFAPCPQPGSVIYQQPQMIIAPAPSHQMQPILTSQGQMQYYAMPQTVPQVIPLAQARAVPHEPPAASEEKPAITPEGFTLQDDKPLIP